MQRWCWSWRREIGNYHTDVPSALRGRKVGERLVRQAVEDARRDGTAIVPLCPFAKAQIDRHPEWQDVVSKS